MIYGKMNCKFANKLFLVHKQFMYKIIWFIFMVCLRYAFFFLIFHFVFFFLLLLLAAAFAGSHSLAL